MSRNLLIALAALAAVVLLGVFVVMPLVLDVEEVEDDPVVADPDDPDPEPDDTPAEPELGEDPPDDVDPVDPVEETYEIGIARDPFQQLVEEPDAPPAPADPDPDDPDPDDPDPDDPDPDDPDDPPAAPPDDEVVDGTTIRLNEVYFDTDEGQRRAQVEVNATGYDVAEGDEFARRLRLLDLAESCATMLYGDQRFTLCEGETIRK